MIDATIPGDKIGREKMGWQQRQIVATAVIAAALIAIYVAVQRGIPWPLMVTHSIEVAQVARSIARALGLDEDLTEALALAHDLGHPAFGHAGEEALNLAMKPFGGFDHNAQSLRVTVDPPESWPRLGEGLTDADAAPSS